LVTQAQKHNLTEKQAQNAFRKKIEQRKNQQVN